MELQDLEAHIGHEITIAYYEDKRSIDSWENVALECLECETTIYDLDYPTEEKVDG